MRQINYWFYIPALVCLGLGAWIMRQINYGEELFFFNPWRHEPYNRLMRLLTASAEGYVYVAMALFLVFGKKYRYAILLALSGLLTMPAAYYLKRVYGSSRPARWLDEVGRKADITFVPEVDLSGGLNSFPSGHTMSAFAVYGFMAFLLVRRGRAPWGLPLLLLAVLVGISRIFLVQHFLRDVMAGAISGIAIAWLMWGVNILFERYFVKK